MRVLLMLAGEVLEVERRPCPTWPVWCWMWRCLAWAYARELRVN